ncbi:uncharacterized protein KGF55_001758 [Candida pseudojiufengensis]|uniref:uncharacterized protein n=1 Tax=Candida pseudojiufengensis TaxID=497109 RepID=UPI00222463C0|nr:uncharacterized protein KGF55_001758 [Candida pseudojiufengensis]KAI5964689.1 hypothetical protein KGF55_001758 [Candida pseudojiufengensis]
MVQIRRLPLTKKKLNVKLMMYLRNIQARLPMHLYLIGFKNLKMVFKSIFYQRSIVIAFSFPYICEVLPKIIKTVIKSIFDLKFNDIHIKIWKILKDPFKADRLPIFMIKLIATLNALNPLLLKLLVPYVDGMYIQFLSTFLAALIASLLNFPYFQELKISQDRFYTFDWTLLLITKASDTILSSLATNYCASSPISGSSVDLLLSIASTYLISDAFWFHPEKLNPNYVRWINKISVIDPEVVEGIRYLKDGTLDYQPYPNEQGKLCHQDHYEKYALKNNKDPALGDIKIQNKLPCEVLHQFRTKSCKENTLLAFMRQFKTTFKFYSYINLFMYIFVRRFRGKFVNVIKKTIRSSLFISSLNAIQWGCICLIRNHHPDWRNQKYWDIIAPKIGSAFAGLSILFENPQRRNDVLLFVIPKALGTFIDLKPTPINKLLEIFGFSLSFAVLVAFARSNPHRLRGLVGRGLSYMVK